MYQEDTNESRMGIMGSLALILFIDTMGLGSIIGPIAMTFTFGVFTKNRGDIADCPSAPFLLWALLAIIAIILSARTMNQYHQGNNYQASKYQNNENTENNECWPIACKILLYYDKRVIVRVYLQEYPKNSRERISCKISCLLLY